MENHSDRPVFRRPKRDNICLETGHFMTEFQKPKIMCNDFKGLRCEHMCGPVFSRASNAPQTVFFMHPNAVQYPALPGCPLRVPSSPFLARENTPCQRPPRHPISRHGRCHCITCNPPNSTTRPYLPSAPICLVSPRHPTGPTGPTGLTFPAAPPFRFARCTPCPHHVQHPVFIEIIAVGAPLAGALRCGCPSLRVPFVPCLPFSPCLPVVTRADTQVPPLRQNRSMRAGEWHYNQNQSINAGRSVAVGESFLRGKDYEAKRSGKKRDEAKQSMFCANALGTWTAPQAGLRLQNFLKSGGG